MQRPMFKLGGSARPGYQNSNYQDLVKQIRQDLTRRSESRDKYLKGIKSVLPLSVLASASGLGQIRKPMDVVNVLSEIGTNPATFAALMKSKSIDMKMDEGAFGLTPGAGTVTTQSGIPAAQASPLGSALTAGIGAFSLGNLFGLG